MGWLGRVSASPALAPGLATPAAIWAQPGQKRHAQRECKIIEIGGQNDRWIVC